MVIGLSGGMAATLKYNLIGTWVGIGAVWLFQEGWRNARSRLEQACVGACTIWLLVVLYLTSSGSMEAWWDATVRYNTSYVGAADAAQRTGAIWYGITLLAPTGLSVLTPCAWLMVLAAFASGQCNSRVRPLLLWLAIDFPIEWLSASLTGRTYDQYFVPSLPVGAGLSAYFAAVVYSKWRSVASPLLILLFLVMAAVPSRRLAHQLLETPLAGARSVALSFIKDQTSPVDTVLVWGAETSINFLSQRRSPSRFSYQYPLWAEGYTSTDIAYSFLSDLGANPPALIIDTSSTNDLVPPLDPLRRTRWVVGHEPLPAAEKKMVDLVRNEYRLFARIDPAGWDVYRRLASWATR